MAHIAVAILNYNGQEHLKKFLPSVIEHSSDARIVIGDNASTDDSINFLASNFPAIEVVPLEKNYGYAGGYNRLIDKIDEEFIILANSDIEVTSGWIQPLVDILNNNPRVAAVQPKILSYNQREQFEYAGAGGGFIDKYGYPFCRGRIFSSVEKDNGQYDDEISVFWASGACFLVRKSVFIAAGGFDEAFFAHMEEIDLDWRLQKAGHEIKYTGKSVIYHLGGGTLSYDNPRKTYLNFRNGWMMMIKNLSEYNRTSVFVKRFLLDLMSQFFFLLQLKPKNAFAVMKAHYFILTHLSKIKKSTTTDFAQAKNSSIIPPENYSIVWRFFLRNKKKFSEL